MIDANLQFSNNQLATGFTAVSTNVVDMLVARDIGVASPLMCGVFVTTAFTSGGAGTLQISWQGSVDNVTFFDLLFSPVFALSSLILFRDGLWKFAIPPKDPNLVGADNLPRPARYYRLNYINATAVFTAGAVNSFITSWQDMDQFTGYARGYTI